MTSSSTHARVHARRSVLPPLGELAALYNIQTSYRDCFGQHQTASTDALIGTLQALGAALSGVAETREAIRARRAELVREPLAPVQISWDGRLSRIALQLPAQRTSAATHGVIRLTLHLESGETLQRDLPPSALTPSPATHAAAGTLRLNPSLRLPIGYHHLKLDITHSGHRSDALETLVIAAPVRCYSPPGTPQQKWGAFLPLYALRSRGDWGTGNFSSLGKLHRWVREMGGALTGTLPLLASFLDEPCEPSPYKPISRLFWNELYVDPTSEPEFSESSATHRGAALQIVESTAWQQQIREIRSAPLVDYRRAMALKRTVLEAMAEHVGTHRNSIQSTRSKAFRDYVSAHPQLQDYARFRALQEQRSEPWTEWPTRPRSGCITAGDAAAARVVYHQYVQWLAEGQLGKISKSSAARRNSDAALGADGLYLDFPLGVHPEGYDVWRHQSLFAHRASAGAPPDGLFPNGQKWEFPPLDPQANRRDGYRYLRDCLQHHMRHASLLRIDHVMGLHRLYWIPEGIDTRQGVYVGYPHQEMYAVLSIESHRARTVIAGENLGTVPTAVNRAMKRHQTHGLYVFQFAVSPNARTPISAPSQTDVASLNTHDTPPFAGYVAGRDVDDFERLGVFSRERAAAEKLGRRKTVAALARHFALRAKTGSEAGKLLPHCLEYLGSSPAKTALINLEDLWLEDAPQNIPGTGAGTSSPDVPNWRRKTRKSLEQIRASREIRQLLQMISKRRNAQRRSHV
ncbi:MAG: 4-alpha-glucanotransferase [Acidobacteria bacterium]|nr:4-alpha-glucanotransferase [Acidobacteriota bacterium]